MQKPSLSQSDFEQLKQHGISKLEIYEQLKTFQQGIPFINITKAATIENGVFKLSDSQHKTLIETYDFTDCETIKFIPASGSATRMFKLLHQFINEVNPDKDDILSSLNSPQFSNLNNFYHQLTDLPFYQLVKAEMSTKYPGELSLSAEEEFYNFVRFMLDEMDYSNLPKGLIPFHQYDCKTVTAFEEHLYEAAQYLKDKKGVVRLHFTIAKEHLNQFKATFKNVQQRIEAATKTHFEISYSYQEKSTDTIAVDQDNKPYRIDNNELLLRPGGHGALIQNLNNIEADLVFIKNIDNVVTEENQEFIAKHKKVLAGFLIKIQQQIFNLLKKLDKQGFSENIQKEAQAISLKYFHQKKGFKDGKAIKNFFNRPLRVCGMVENKGEPGGGPFWVNQEGKTTLQIVEKAQINLDDKLQADIQQQSTHFNPVDIVCGLKDYQGEKYDLLNYINPNQGFIVNKSINGQSLKALELPGLWNGAMAYWNTIFIEVPLETFNPVKTVADLLKPQHQVAYS